MQFFKYKYREGRIRNQSEILKELPYDMQVGMQTREWGTLHWPCHACQLPIFAVTLKVHHWPC